MVKVSPPTFPPSGLVPDFDRYVDYRANLWAEPENRALLWEAWIEFGGNFDPVADPEGRIADLEAESESLRQQLGEEQQSHELTQAALAQAQQERDGYRAANRALSDTISFLEGRG